MFYSNLEPNHRVEILDEVQVVICPFEDDTGESFYTPWSLNADPDEVNCLFCEYLNGALYHAGSNHGGEPPDGPPPIVGSSHGGRHHISEYACCRIPLRRFTFLGVSVVGHEGAIASMGRINDKWLAKGGPSWYLVRQADTAMFVCRTTRGGSSCSKHGLCAIDINWQTNPWKTRKCDHPLELRRWFKEEGWGHGLDWESVGDPMHYSKSINEGGNGWLYVSGPPTSIPTVEDDEMKVMYLLKATGSGAVWLCPDLDYRQVLGSMNELSAIKDATVKAGGKVTEIIEVSQEFLQAIRPRV